MERGELGVYSGGHAGGSEARSCGPELSTVHENAALHRGKHDTRTHRSDQCEIPAPAEAVCRPRHGEHAAAEVKSTGEFVDGSEIGRLGPNDAWSESHGSGVGVNLGLDWPVAELFNLIIFPSRSLSKRS